MNKEKKCIPSDCFERYEFEIPIKKLLGKLRSSYIYTELLKRHPCFSDEFCYDFRMKLYKRRIFTDVLVMNKVLLERKMSTTCINRIFGLRLENIKGRRFSMIKFSYVLMFVFAIFFIFSLYALMGRYQLHSKQSVISPQAVWIEKEEVKYEAAGVLLKQLLLLQEPHLSEISDLTWKVDGASENLCVSMANTYPEDVIGLFVKEPGSDGSENSSTERSLSPKIIWQPIIYTNGSPNLSFTVQQHIASFYAEQSQIKRNIGRDIRDSLAKYDALLIEEREIPYFVRFNLEDGSNVNGLFCELAAVIQNHNFFVTEIDIKKTEKNDFTPAYHISFLLQEGSEKNKGVMPANVFEILSKSDFFRMSSYVAKKEDMKMQQAIIKGGGDEKKEGDLPSIVIKNKVGEIKQKNGERVVFYKDDDGKMQKMILK